MDKRGAKSDEAYVREVLGEMAAARNLLVINDEAHHAWRVPGTRRPRPARRDLKDSAKRPRSGSAAWTASTASRGILSLLRLLGHAVRALGQAEQRGGPVRLDRQRLRPERRHRVGPGQDAARGRPRRRACPMRKTYKSRLYHIYNDPEVKDDLNRKAERAGAAAGPGDQRLLPAGQGLAGDGPSAGTTAGPPDPAGDDHRRPTARRRRPG